MPNVALPEPEQLHELLRAFVRLRWAFVASLALSVLVGACVFAVDFPVAKTLAVGGIVFAYNVAFSIYYQLRPVAPELRISRFEAVLQIGLDLFALTSLVHFLGGAESPFIVLYLIHALVGGMLLSSREAWVVAVAAFGLFVTVVALEAYGILVHYHPAGRMELSGAHRLHFEVGICAAFLATLIISVSITNRIMEGLRMREQRLVEIQHALEKKSADLEHACDTLARNQQQLAQAEKQASLGRLVAGIAHEINNPIQFIHGNMSVLSEAFLDVLPILDECSAAKKDLRIARLDYPFFRTQVPTLLKDMADGASRIRAIVRDLRTFARRDEGDLDQVVDLAETVRASLRLLHNQLKHLKVEVDLDPNVPPLRGNLTQLQQVVVNALQNASQAMRPGAEGRIRVRMCAEEAGAWVRLSVEDNGCGIPEQVRGRIFDPFYTTKQRSGGTGLGLSITQGIIQQHQGRIELQSQVGEGSTFHFLVPVRRNSTV